MTVFAWLLRLFYVCVYELECAVCVVLDYNLLHLNPRFCMLLSWVLSHRIYWFWESRVSLPCISNLAVLEETMLR